MRRTEDITVTTEHGQEVETHPAFAVATVTRVHGGDGVLFQSDVRHHESIRLAISRADRRRDLSTDRVFPTKQLIEVELSLAQWGSLVSSIGIGSGVPVTIRSTTEDRMVPGMPYAPRIASNISEVEGAIDKALNRVQERFDALAEAIDEKKGAKAIREAKRALELTISHAKGNASFAVERMVEAGESVVSQVRADIESQVLNAHRAVGGDAAIAAPTFDATVLAVEESR